MNLVLSAGGLHFMGISVSRFDRIKKSIDCRGNVENVAPFQGIHRKVTLNIRQSKTSPEYSGRGYPRP